MSTPGAPSTARRIGVLGGSFDPIHMAHLALGEAALASLELDQLRFIPAGRPWQRPPLGASPAKRLAMVKLALAERPKFVADDREIEREGPSYTVDTLESLHRTYPEAQFWLILGGDQLANFPTWRDWPRILSLSRLAVAERAGAPISVPADLVGIPIDRIPMPPMGVSATDIRARLAAGQSVKGLLPEKVLDYIRTERLYERGRDESPN